MLALKHVLALKHALSHERANISTVALHITTAEYAEQLIAHLADSIGGPRPDPFVEELVVVPSAGVRRWVEQQLALTTGVCANIRFLLPGRLTANLRAASHHGTDDAWRLEAITGAVFDLGNPHRDEDLAPSLAALHGSGSWMARSRYIADLFDRYLMHRPHMLRNWAIGNDVDGLSQPITQGARWQPTLWRLVHERLGRSPAERLPQFLAGLAAGDQIPTRAETVHVFGLSAMSREFVQIVSALSESTNVSLYIPVTSETRASELLTGNETIAGVNHPLLAAWGRSEQRGLELTRDQTAETTRTIAHSSFGDSPITLLGHVQDQIRRNAIPAVAGTGADTSLQVHSCSGYARQVEILRDAILHVLASDPTLTEADIVVLCPQIDRFGPLIEAAWGVPAAHDAPTMTDALPDFRYHINHRSLSSAAPLVDAVQQFVQLVHSNVTHSSLASFLTLPVVRSRFRIDDDQDLTALVGWLADTSMRWGVNVEQRRRQANLPESFSAHTLASSTASVVASMAYASDQIIDSGASTIQLELSQFDLAGTLADIASVLHECEQSWAAGPAVHAQDWVDRLHHVVHALFAVDPSESWQHGALNDVFDTLLTVGSDGPMRLDDLVDALRDIITARPGWRHFGRGSIIVDQPQALRAVPHEVICLLGFDDDALPSPASTGDDLIAAAPLPGDRDARLDSRQQLLDAVMSARRNLIITYSGHNVHTNADIPPSIPLQELLDVASVASGIESKDLITEQPKHAHTAENFTGDRPWSFDPLALDMSLTRSQRRITAVSEHSDHYPLPREPIDRMSTDDLIRAATEPTKILLHDRLQISMPWVEPLPADVLPVDPSALDKWALGSTLFQYRLDGRPDELWVQHQRAQGRLSPGRLGDGQVDRAIEAVDAIMAQLRLAVHHDPASAALHLKQAPIHVEAGGVTISGLVEHDEHGAVHMSWASRKGADSIRLWVEALLLAEAGIFGDSRWFSQKSGKASILTVRIDPAAHIARQSALEHLVALYRRAWHEPVPLFRETTALIASGDLGKAETSWSGGHFGGDRARADVAMFYSAATFDDLLQPPINARHEADALWRHVSATTADWTEQ